MENFIVAGILIILIGAIIFYLAREKKKGRKCIGCPYAKQCGSHSKGCRSGTSLFIVQNVKKETPINEKENKVSLSDNK